MSFIVPPALASGIQAMRNPSSAGGLDLRGAQLRDFDLRGADLSGARLTGADLTNCRLDGASLAGAMLQDATLKGASLAGANLTSVRREGLQPEDTTRACNLDSLSSGMWRVGPRSRGSSSKSCDPSPVIRIPHHPNPVIRIP